MVIHHRIWLSKFACPAWLCYSLTATEAAGLLKLTATNKQSQDFYSQYAQRVQPTIDLIFQKPTMDFIIKFAQAHESFRVAEIQALAVIESVDLEVLEYSDDSPFCIARLPSVRDAQRLIRRSILAQSVHELWGTGATFDALHQSVKERTSKLWADYKSVSFKFTIDSYQGTHSNNERLSIINTFDYLPFEGPIRRLVGKSSRETVLKFDLKKRGYISTTSMDSELSLITANIALAGPGKLFYDPFVGTGSFPIACACFGAMAWGSDIDGRSIRGEGGAKSLRGNFQQYYIKQRLGDVFAADLMNSPIKRDRRIWDGIVCDPPYGVREGLRVLGLKDPEKTPWLVEQGKKMLRTSSIIRVIHPTREHFGLRTQYR
ncbi:hypothetical protein J3459_017493 [Metarhizium acridum]|nr:hypothetical protein J3459_017493 [Metarhizium acridum]